MAEEHKKYIIIKIPEGLTEKEFIDRVKLEVEEMYQKMWKDLNKSLTLQTGQQEEK